jgi:Holliday junction resolvase RusA-like endonuclease
MGQLTIVLSGERSPSVNEYYSTPHWAKRNKIAQTVHQTVQNRLREMGIGPGETCNNRVSITVIGYFDKRPLDASNISLKLYEDALKGWLIEDDSPKYVEAVTAVSKVDKANPRVEIILTEVL